MLAQNDLTQTQCENSLSVLMMLFSFTLAQGTIRTMKWPCSGHVCRLASSYAVRHVLWR